MSKKAAPQSSWTIPKRGPIGSRWWTEAILAVCDGVLDRGRLSRGATYGRAGKVVDVAVGPGYVDALVMGSRRRPYETSLIWPRWSGAALEQLEHRLGEQRDVLAALLAGDLPEAFGTMVTAAGLSLAPRRVTQDRRWRQLDLEFSCSCPDYGYPCKHGAALLLAFLHRCDTAPQWLLTVCGLDLERLALRPAASATPVIPQGRFYRAGDGLAAIPLDVQRSANPAAILGALGPLTLQVGRKSVGAPLIEAYDILSATAMVWARDLSGSD